MISWLQPSNENSLFMVTTGGDYRVTFTYVPNVADGKQIKVLSFRIIVIELKYI